VVENEFLLVAKEKRIEWVNVVDLQAGSDEAVFTARIYQ
jgi:hypothetical protein